MNYNLKKPEDNTLTEEVTEAYNKFGRMYHESRMKKERLFNEFLEMPAVLSFIPDDLHDLTVLDAGCGSGIYSRELAKRGAHVVAIDLSDTMIAIALEETPASENIDYQVGNICKTSLIKGSVDLIVCNYVLENIEDIHTVFAEFFRVLKPGGQCTYSISHPLRAMAHKLINDGHEIWQLENYYDRTFRISDFGQGMQVKKIKRTLADYINSNIEAGFTIHRLGEPQPISGSEKQNPVLYELAMRLPQLLLVTMMKEIG